MSEAQEQKRPRKSPAEMAVIHAERAESARRKAIQATPAWKAVSAAEDAISEVRGKMDLEPGQNEKLAEIGKMLWGMREKLETSK